MGKKNCRSFFYNLYLIYSKGVCMQAYINLLQTAGILQTSTRNKEIENRNQDNDKQE